MAINFPDSPSISDTITVGDITWTWDGTSWVATAAPTGGGGVDLTAFSVATLGASGSGSLTYNNTNGVFSFRPADLSSYVTGDTGVVAGTYGDGSTVAQFTVNDDGQITSVTEVAISGVGATGDTNGERFKVNYASDGTLASITNLTSGITSVNIDSASGGEITITFDNATYNFPPHSILMYGYDYTNNKYIISPVESTMSLREVDAKGTSGSPILFNGGSTVELRLRVREAETGASRSFGTITHAWVQFVMFG